MYACMLSRFLSVQLFATPWTVAHQAPLSMEFSRQECRSDLPCPPPGDLPDPEIELVSPVSPALQADFFAFEPLGKPCVYDKYIHMCIKFYYLCCKHFSSFDFFNFVHDFNINFLI